MKCCLFRLQNKTVALNENSAEFGSKIRVGKILPFNFYLAYMRKDKTEYSPDAVYTIIPQQDVRSAYESNGSGTISEGKLWQTAKKDFDSLGNQKMLLLLADASNIKGAEWIAIIDDIQIEAKTSKTIVTFSNLTKLRKIFPPNRIALRNGNRLSANHIRTYVLCKLPISLVSQLDNKQNYAHHLSGNNHPKEITSRQANIESRTTQNIFRKNLLKKYKTCAVTGCSNEALLIASHIVRWADATDAERQDVSNGLLLVAPIDYLFDSYLISFDEGGKILISKSLTTKDKKIMGIQSNMALKTLTKEQRIYLSRHRVIFNKKVNN